MSKRHHRFDDDGGGLSWLDDADDVHFQDDVTESNLFGGSFGDIDDEHTSQPSLDRSFASPSHSFASPSHSFAAPSPSIRPVPEQLQEASFSLPPSNASKNESPVYTNNNNHPSSYRPGLAPYPPANPGAKPEEDDDDDVVEIKPQHLQQHQQQQHQQQQQQQHQQQQMYPTFPTDMSPELLLQLMHTYNLPYQTIVEQLTHAQYLTPQHVEHKPKKVKRGVLDMASMLGATRPSYPTTQASYTAAPYPSATPEDQKQALPKDELYGTLLTPLKALGVFKQIIAKGENVLLKHYQLPEDNFAMRVDKDYGEDNIIGFLDRKSGTHLAHLVLSNYGQCIRLEGRISDVTADYKTGSAKVLIYGPNRLKQFIERTYLSAADLKYIPVVHAPPATLSSFSSSSSSSSSSGSSASTSSSSSSSAASSRILHPNWGDEDGENVIIDLQMEGDVDKLFEQQADIISKIKPQEPPNSVITSLFPYQKQALAWMLQREEKRAPGDDTRVDARGGILADDMGLGKTLQLICLIASTAKSAGYPETPGVGASTLIVCPLSVMSNWQAQIRAHIKLLRLNVATYHGPTRKQTAEFSQYDVVITTYNIVSTEFKENREKSPLFSHSWRRVVLDEAHVIRGKRTQQFQGVCTLTAERRWCVTGTPIQNVLEDLYALLAFLRVRPYADHDLWTKRIALPLKHGDSSGLERLQNVLGALCLRRKKTDKDHLGVPILPPLPTKRVRVWGLPFSGVEGALYAKLMASGKAQVESPSFDTSSRRMLHFVLEMLLRLRQCCNHAALVPRKYLQRGFDRNGDENERLQELLKDGSEECCVCLKDRASVCSSCCQSLFCSDCSKHTEFCPNCGKDLEEYPMINAKEKVTVSEEEVNLEKGPFELSPKLKFFVDKMKEFQSKDPTFKVVVFSQWTTVLTLIQRTLRGEATGHKDFNFKHVRLDGSMSHKARQEAINAFQEDKDVRVFIISLSAGGVGLNLTAANKVFMMDPWWNPATEDQAIDRVHRLGQTREVEVYRLVMKDSLEERIMDLQKKKRDMCSTALGGQFRKGKSRQEMKAERMAELMALFE